MAISLILYIFKFKNDKPPKPTQRARQEVAHSTPAFLHPHISYFSHIQTPVAELRNDITPPAVEDQVHEMDSPEMAVAAGGDGRWDFVYGEGDPRRSTR